MTLFSSEKHKNFSSLFLLEETRRQKPRKEKGKMIYVLATLASEVKKETRRWMGWRILGEGIVLLIEFLI